MTWWQFTSGRTDAGSTVVIIFVFLLLAGGIFLVARSVIDLVRTRKPSTKLRERRKKSMPTHPLPVRIHQTENQFAIAAPLAGLEPEDIHVKINGRHVTIDGKQRGPRQDQLDLIQVEWSVGPYHREINMGEDLDGSTANATYGNGVLVLTVPKASATGRRSGVEFTLKAVSPTRGEHVGHTGHDVMPVSTAA